MKKRNMKFMALLLTLTMVFTSNVVAFGENINVDVEAVEDDAPEVVGLDEHGEIGGQYQTGFNKGVTDRGVDEGNNNTDEYDAVQDTFKKTDGTAPSLAYQAGYNDGYSGNVYREDFTNALNGFNHAYGNAVVWDDASNKTIKEDQHGEYLGEADFGKAHVAAYKAGFDSGEETGKKQRLLDAWNDGYSDGIGDYKDYAKNDSYFTTDDFKNNIETPNKDNEGYTDEYKKGYVKAFDHAAKINGYQDGRFAALTDKVGDNRKSFDSVKSWKDKAVADVEKYETDTPAAGFTARWKTYWNQWEKDDKGNAKNPGTDIVGETYIANYQKGYDAGYDSSTILDTAKKTEQKNIYNQGFTDGWYIGTQVAPNNDTSKYDDDKNKVGGTYYEKVNNDEPAGLKDNPYLQDYKDGYEAGYAAAFKSANNTTVGYTEGYDAGYISGAYDAARDWYTRNPYNGYYEPADPKSAYSLLTDSTQYGKGYRTGYMDGYESTVNSEKTYRENGSVYDYTAKDFDEWRISSDPLTWNTTQILVGESDIQRDQTNLINENYFFDTYQFYDEWEKGNDPTPDFRNRFGEGSGAGSHAGLVLATSPFQYYFDLAGNDHLIDKKTVSYNITEVIDDVYLASNDYGINRGSVGMYNYAALQVSGNKPKKGVSSNGTPYVIIRYRLAGAETDENYTVWRYAYDANGNETPVTDHITDYYIGDDGKNEPVVPYDTRKIVGKKPVKKTKNQFMDNDKKNRYIIDAEALLITWEPGKPAVLVGPIDVDAKAKNNVNATVSHNYLNFKGETEIAAYRMTNDLHPEYTNPDPVELKQTDKGVDPINGPGAAYYSRYYKVSTENEKIENEWKDVMGRITFAPAENVPKLTPAGKGATDINASSAFVKANKNPSFTLKAKKLSPAMKPYSKGIKKALKGFTANFEISRMKMASDYNSNIDTVLGNVPYNAYLGGEFTYPDEDVMKLLTPPKPVRRRDFSMDAAGTEKFKAAAREYDKLWQEYTDYTNSVDAGDGKFQETARAAFKEAAEAYKAEYDSVVAKYSSHLDYFKKYIEETWAVDDANNDLTFDKGPQNDVTFPYTVTKLDRTNAAGEQVPVGNTAAYKKAVPEDANCDGIITAIEHYEYEHYGVDDPRFDGVVQPGDNITGYSEGLTKFFDTIDWENVDVNVVWDDPTNPQSGVERIDFTYYYYDENGDQNNEVISDFAEWGDWDMDYSDLYGSFEFENGFTVYYDFLEDRDTDIEIVENNKDIKVLWPGEENVFSYNGELDSLDIDFLDPKVKGGKKGQTLTIKPVLHMGLFSGRDKLGLLEPPLKVEKKLKTSTVKANKDGTFKDPKPGKADLLIKNYMAEIEPFIVVTGVNNYEGQIAIRQRQNGDVGFGYFKNDDFYYIFSDEK